MDEGLGNRLPLQSQGSGNKLGRGLLREKTSKDSRKVKLETTTHKGLGMEYWRHVLAKFATLVGLRDSSEAEFITIVTALELSFEKEWLKRDSLIVELDSNVSLAWVKSSCPWILVFYGNKLRNIQWVLGNVTFVHKTRESNGIVDSLAKEGASLDGSWVNWLLLESENGTG